MSETGPGRAPDWTPFCYCNGIKQLVGRQEVLFGVGPVLRDDRQKMLELEKGCYTWIRKNKMQRNPSL